MSDTSKPKRPASKPARERSRPPPLGPAPRDLRAEPTTTPPEGEAGAKRSVSRPRAELPPTRTAALEAQVARLTEQRGAEADDLAAMLVRIAEAERARSAAEARASALAEASSEVEARWQESQRALEASREQLRRSAEAADTAARRAGLAENSAADGAAALDRTRAELEADRARVTDLEAKLARVRREHTAELAVLRAKEADMGIHASLARQQARAAEAELAAAREVIAQVTALLDEMERREEMTAAVRTRALEKARRILQSHASTDSGDAADKQPPVAKASLPAPAARPPGPSRPDEMPSELLTLDEADLLD